MNLSTKILLIISAIVLICTLGFIVYTQHQISTRQTDIQTQVVAMKQLADNISRAQASWATKEDLDTFAKQHNLDLQAIKNDLATLNASVTAINVSTTNSQGQIANNLPSTSTTPNITGPTTTPPTVDCNGTKIPCPDTDPNKYFANRQVYHLNEIFGTTTVPIGDVGFSAWQAKPWDINVSPRQYNATTVIGTDENQRQYAYNKFTIKVGDKDYPVSITSNSFLQEYPTAKFSFWNPRLYLGIDGGLNVSRVRGEFTPSANVSFMSYGKYKNQPDFAILGAGIGYGLDSRTPQVMITPVTYNVGQHLPLMNNLYVGPTVQIGTNGEVTVAVGFRVGM